VIYERSRKAVEGKDRLKSPSRDGLAWSSPSSAPTSTFRLPLGATGAAENLKPSLSSRIKRDQQLAPPCERQNLFKTRSPPLRSHARTLISSIDLNQPTCRQTFPLLSSPPTSPHPYPVTRDLPGLPPKPARPLLLHLEIEATASLTIQITSHHHPLISTHQQLHPHHHGLPVSHHLHQLSPTPPPSTFPKTYQPLRHLHPNRPLRCGTTSHMPTRVWRHSR